MNGKKEQKQDEESYGKKMISVYELNRPKTDIHFVQLNAFSVFAFVIDKLQ